MINSVLILSEDAVFARMLELELQMRRISAQVCTGALEGTEAAVILADLDTSVIPDATMGSRIIGFTRSDTVTATDPDRRCSMILHRPFEVSRLVDEVEGLLCQFALGVKKDFTLTLVKEKLFFGEKYVSLSPKEVLLMDRLLSRRDAVLTREEMAHLIGVSSANKPEVYVCLLRKKLNLLTKTVTIRTLRGIGYRLEEI